MSENCISNVLVEQKAKKIEGALNSLKKQSANAELLGVLIEQLEEIQATLQKIFGIFSNFGTKENTIQNTEDKTGNFDQLKELIKVTCRSAKNKINIINQTEEEITKLFSYIEKTKEVDVIIGALEIVAQHTKDSVLAKNLENLTFYIKENGTGNDSITLLSRASWKY